MKSNKYAYIFDDIRDEDTFNDEIKYLVNTGISQYEIAEQVSETGNKSVFRRFIYQAFRQQEYINNFHTAYSFISIFFANIAFIIFLSNQYDKTGLSFFSSTNLEDFFIVILDISLWGIILIAVLIIFFLGFQLAYLVFFLIACSSLGKKLSKIKSQSTIKYFLSLIGVSLLVILVLLMLFVLMLNSNSDGY